MRLFIALWPAMPVRHALAALNVADGARVRAENLHLTLAFLGEQAPARVPELRRLLADLDWPGCTLRIDRMGKFGKKGDYTLWAGVSDCPAALSDLQRHISNALDRLGLVWSAETRFVPHVTLARHALAAWPRQSPQPAIVWTPDQPVLVRSDTTPAGPRYSLVDQ